MENVHLERKIKKLQKDTDLLLDECIEEIEKLEAIIEKQQEEIDSLKGL